MKLYTIQQGANIVEPRVENGVPMLCYIGDKFVCLFSGEWPSGTDGLQPVDNLRAALPDFVTLHGEDTSLMSEDQRMYYQVASLPTLEEAVAEALATVKAVHAGMLAKLSGEYTIEERDTWPQQQAWADAYVANQDEEAKGYLLDMLPASIIDDLTANNVDPAGYLATKIRTKARINKKLMVIAGRVKTEANASYSAATSLEDVATITAGLEAKQAEAMQEFAAYVEANT